MFGITSAATVKQIEGQPFALVGGVFLEHDSGCQHAVNGLVFKSVKTFVLLLNDNNNIKSLLDRDYSVILGSDVTSVSDFGFLKSIPKKASHFQLAITKKRTCVLKATKWRMIFTVKYSGTFSFLHEGSHTGKHFVESSFCGTDDSSSSCSVDVSGRYILCSGRKKRLTCSWVLKAFASTTVRERATRKLQIFIAVFSASFLQKQT